MIEEIEINILGTQELSYGFDFILTKTGETVWTGGIAPGTYGAPRQYVLRPGVDADTLLFRSFDTEMNGHSIKINKMLNIQVPSTLATQWSDWATIKLAEPLKILLPLIIMGLGVGILIIGKVMKW